MTIDELVVKLVVDVSGFKQGQRDAENATGKLKQSVLADAKATEAAVAKVTAGVEALGRRFLGLYALVTAGRGLREFVSDLTTADSALGRTAKNIDLGAKALSTWQLAAEASGGSAAGITGVMRNLSGELQRAALTGQSSVIPAFKALGITLADSRGRARDVRDILTDMNRRAQGMDPAKFTALANLAGISDEGTISMLEMKTEEFDKLIAAQQKYAATQADADAAQKRQTGWRELLITSTSIGRTILTAVTPALVAMMKAVQEWANGKDWTKLSKPISDFLETLTNADWKGFIGQAEDLATKLASIATAADDAAKGVDGNSLLFKGLGALGALAGVQVLNSVVALTTGLGKLASIPVTGLLARILTNPVGLTATALTAGGLADAEMARRTGAAMTSGDPNARFDPETGFVNDLDFGFGDKGADGAPSGGKAWAWFKGLLGSWAGGPDDATRHRFNDAERARTGSFSYVPTAADTEHPPPGSGTPANGGFWNTFKRLYGIGGDDSKVKEGVEATAKSTAGIFDLMKRQADGLGGGIEGSFGGANAGHGGNAGMPNLRYGRGAGGGYRHGRGGGGDPNGAFNAKAPDKPGTYRPEYKLSDADLDDYVVGTVAGEAVTSNPESVDAVINNMMNRLGSKGWGPSANLHDVASAPGQYAGHRKATAQEAERIRARIRAIASGGVPDNTNGSNAYRAAWYDGPWARQHAADGRVVGGNRFAFEPGVPNGPYAPYKTPHGTPEAAPTAQAPVPSGTSAQAVTDAQVQAARLRLINGSRDPADHALVGRYLKEQNTPPPKHGKPLPSWMAKGGTAEGMSTTDWRDPKFAPYPAEAPTLHHAVHTALVAIGRANKMLRHDGAPIPVDVTERGATRIAHPINEALRHRLTGAHRAGYDHGIARAMDQASDLAHVHRAAGFARHAAAFSPVTQHNDHSSTTTIGSMTVHTKAENGRELAADLERHLARSREAAQFNSGLA